MKPKHWLVFILLGAIWSASFLWIKIAVAEIDPFSLVALRVLSGALTAGGAAVLLRARWPRDRRAWLDFLLLGVISLAVPFFLISWGETAIDSAVASILNATVPLFTILLAHTFLSDDRITPARALGLLTGFAGVVVLLSEDLGASPSSLIGQGAVLLAALFYAGSSVYARRATAHLDGLARSAGPLFGASLAMWALAAVDGAPLQVPQLPITWTAVLWLGVLGSGLAQILYFYLLHEIGPTRATLVTYVFPLGGVILGVLFLGEHLSWQLAVGALLIISGIVVVNRNRG